MPDYVRKVGSIDHSFAATLSDASGPVDLPVGTTVSMVAWLPGAEATPRINRPGVVLKPGAPVGDPLRGSVRMDPQAVDMAVPGAYRTQWVIQVPGQPTPQPFPEDGYMTLVLLTSP